MANHAWVWSVLLYVFHALVIMIPEPILAAHSRRRVVFRKYVEPRYDRSITTFTEDGRLAQVEYGMEASLRGSTIAAVVTSQGIIFWIAHSSWAKVYRLDHHLWLITAGLSGDARALATMLQRACQQIRMQYGEAATTEEVAKLAGQAQHELTRTGGARPLGCTAIVVGIDPPSMETDETTGAPILGIPRLYETDPGGIVEDCTYCVAGKGRSSLGKVLAPLVDALVSSSKSLFDVAAVITKIFVKEVDDTGKLPVDVWIIQPHAMKRGGSLATCYRNITRETIPNVWDQ